MYNPNHNLETNPENDMWNVQHNYMTDNKMTTR